MQKALLIHQTFCVESRVDLKLCFLLLDGCAVARRVLRSGAGCNNSGAAVPGSDCA